MDEFGELTKTYRESDEWDETEKADKCPAKRNLHSGPGEILSDEDGDAAPQCDKEQQDWL